MLQFLNVPFSGDGQKIPICEVENAGLRTLSENQSVSYEIENNKGKESAIQLKVI
jgi:cold shock CspA family protein